MRIREVGCIKHLFKESCVVREKKKKKRTRTLHEKEKKVSVCMYRKPRDLVSFEASPC
jgi:hypothetical protein